VQLRFTSLTVVSLRRDFHPQECAHAGRTKKEFLKKFLIANGIDDDDFVLHSYEGCTKVDFAKILKGFVREHIPTVDVILHIDRDQKIDADREVIKLKNDCVERNIRLFITKFQEIESYFCTPGHISAIYGVPLDAASHKYEEFVDDLKDETIVKLTNFILRDRPELGANKNNHVDIKVANRRAEEWYKEDKYRFTPGKELLGKIKNYVQSELKADPNLILNASAGLRCPDFQRILK
jgi:hypothetical protein